MDFLYDIISSPFFSELSGNLEDFASQFNSREGYAVELVNYIKS